MPRNLPAPDKSLKELDKEPNINIKILDLGTNIIISPGFQPNMLEYAKNKNYDYIPGVATPSEIEQCLSYGHKYLKFFHAGVFGYRARRRRLRPHRSIITKTGLSSYIILGE